MTMLSKENHSFEQIIRRIENLSFSHEGIHALCKGEDKRFYFDLIQGYTDLIGNFYSAVLAYHKPYMIAAKGSPIFFHFRHHDDTVTPEPQHRLVPGIKKQIAILFELQEKNELVFPEYSSSFFNIDTIKELNDVISQMSNALNDAPKFFGKYYDDFNERIDTFFGSKKVWSEQFKCYSRDPNPKKLNVYYKTFFNQVYGKEKYKVPK